MIDFIKYTFNPLDDADLLPSMTAGFTYTTTDITNGDGTITRTLSCEDDAITNLKNINFSLLDVISIEDLNVSTLTTTYQMFYYCNSLTSLNLSNFNTSKVTDMGGMFNGCSQQLN